jgi:uncharacterized protein (DUF58 family)
MVLRLIVAALVLCGLTLLGLAAYSYFAPPRSPALAVAESDLDLGNCLAGRETDVVFRLQNNSGHPIRVLGLVLC